MSTIKKLLMMFMRLILAPIAMSIAYIELMSSMLLFGVVVWRCYRLDTIGQESED